MSNFKRVAFVHVNNDKVVCPECDKFSHIFFSIATNAGSCDFPLLCPVCAATSGIMFPNPEVWDVSVWPDEPHLMTYFTVLYGGGTVLRK